MEPHDIKSVPFKVKAAGTEDGLEEGQFEGYCSVFGNVDSYGDIVVKGAFTDTLAEWAAKGDPIPLLWGHDFSDPFSNIGSIDSAEEDDHGLKVRGSFDLENPKAQQVYRLAKGRRTTGMSFAYDVRDSEDRDDATYLKSLGLFEASIVPIGANALAGVGAVKALTAELKAGRTLSAKNESTIREAVESLTSVLSSLGDENGKAGTTVSGSHDQDEKASGDPEGPPSDASAEESAPVSDQDSKADPSVALLAAQAKSYALSGARKEHSS